MRIKDQLQMAEIGTRRYLPYLASALPYLQPQAMPITDDIAKTHMRLFTIIL